MQKPIPKFLALNLISIFFIFGIFYGGMYNMTETIKDCANNPKIQTSNTCLEEGNFTFKKQIVLYSPLFGITLFLIGNPILIVLTLSGIKTNDK